MREMKLSVCCLSVLITLAGCTVGPGTPLFDAVQSPRGTNNANVQPPDGYGPPGRNIDSHGLINPQDRRDTEAYLDSLGNR